jgi:hypothetical protein
MTDDIFSNRLDQMIDLLHPLTNSLKNEFFRADYLVNELINTIFKVIMKKFKTAMAKKFDRRNAQVCSRR